MAPGDVLAKHSSREIAEWMAYFKAKEVTAPPKGK